MRTVSAESIADALRRARDAGSIGRLAERLGYRLIAPPHGVPLDDEERTDGSVVERRHIATGGGIEVVLLLDSASTASARAAHIRAALGGVPRPLLLFYPGADTLTVATGGLDGRPRAMPLSLTDPRAVEIETLGELEARDDGTLAALSRHARALDRSAVTRRFFRDFRAQRDAVACSWSGIPERAHSDRNQLALLFLSRLLFLYFLQKQGHLLGSESYLIDLVRRGTLEPAGTSIFRRCLVPLFFGVLNRPIEQRDPETRGLGDLPYLNGGLFERHALERTHPELDLPDTLVIAAFEQLLERYRFTSSEALRPNGTGSHSIQPEMLGRMFEELMAADRRGATGTFYTPAAVVDRLVRRALRGWLAGQPGLDWRAAGMLLRERPAVYGDLPRERLLRDVKAMRVIDPACGSGAFVLGSLERIARLRHALGEKTSDLDLRRELAAHALHGVDVEPDAALLCALRLWLALTPGRATSMSDIQPLPNLDHRVRQGDALLDPLDLTRRGDATAQAWRAAALDPGVRRGRRVLAVLAARYADAATDRRTGIRERLARAEARLARRWVDATARRLERERRDMHLRLRTRDLFGGRNADRRSARAQLARLRDARAELRALARRLRYESALPFFSCAIHFGAQGGTRSGFDLVVSNPPWVRSHRWPRALGSLIRSRYRVCREPGWRAPAPVGSRSSAGGQVDLSLLFVERGVDLLEPNGVLAVLLPTKAFRSLSAGAARALIAQQTQLLAVEDHALHHRAIFRADSFAGALVARATAVRSPNPEPQAIDDVRVTMTHRASRTLRFRTRPQELRLDPRDPRSPWLIVPPGVRRALRAMQATGHSLGLQPGLEVRRGVMTGANDLLLFARAERKLGDAVLAWPVSRKGSSSDSVLLHVADLCPIVRGADLRPFGYDVEGFVAWCHDDHSAEPKAPSRRLARHLDRLGSRLRARPGWRPGLPDGALFRLDRAMLRPRIAWSDIATDLEVTRLPARVAILGTERPLIALNTVYFIALDDEKRCDALAALLSSLPCRVFARSIAERAKDARFRFLAWTVASIPLPHGWACRPALEELARLGRCAHESRDSELANVRAAIDRLTCELFGLENGQVRSLRRFDHWLRGTKRRHWRQR